MKLKFLNFDVNYILHYISCEVVRYDTNIKGNSTAMGKLILGQREIRWLDIKKKEEKICVLFVWYMSYKDFRLCCRR